MSAQEIISELSQLSGPELEKIDAYLHELLRSGRGACQASWGEALLEVAGMAQGLPKDFAHNHDHYLHGTDRR